MMENTKKGRIILSRKGFFNVENEGSVTVCKAATRLRNENVEPLCGDIASFVDNGDGTGFIVGICERRNSFPRPCVANADVLAVVIASADPEPDLFYVDKMTCIGVKNDVETVIVITKNDIRESEKYASIYQKCSFRVFLTSNAEDDVGTEELREFLKGKITVFAGPSGVGKSSLLNRMYPMYNAETGELSKKIMRGRNTTRHTELFPTENGGYIADTPGFTSLDFEKNDLLSLGELVFCFPEMEDYLTGCRFRKCGHTKEIGCLVIDAVNDGRIPASRHDSYVKLFELLKNKSPYQR